MACMCCTHVQYAVVILFPPGLYSVYTPGRHWIACLSPCNLQDACGICNQTGTYIEQAMCRNVNYHEW